MLSIMRPALSVPPGRHVFHNLMMSGSLEEVSERLMFIEMQLFRVIRPEEFLHTNWKDDKAIRPSLNIHALIDRANDFAYWVAKKILNADADARARVIRRFIKLARACLHRGNFNTLFEIVSGLDAHPVSRLRQTWNLLSSKQNEQLDEVRAVIS